MRRLPGLPDADSAARSQPWLDAGLAVGALLAALLTSHHGAPAGLAEFLALRITVANLLLLVALVTGFVLICRLAGLYSPRLLLSARGELVRVLVAAAAGGALALGLAWFTQPGGFTPLGPVYFALVVAGAMLALRGAQRLLAGPTQARARDVLMVGTGPRALSAYWRMFSGSQLPRRLVGVVDARERAGGQRLLHPYLGTLEDFESILSTHPVDEVVVALPLRSYYREVQRLLEVCHRLGVPATLPADTVSGVRSAFRPSLGPGRPVITLEDVRPDWEMGLKRAADLVGASLTLLLLSPLMLLVALAIRVTSPGPIIFSQVRYGYRRRLFRMHKFRTMVADAEALQATVEHLNEAPGPLFKIRQDPRLTPVGRFLRRTSIDELPQLFNVLTGEMSLVGPRPMAVRDVERFTEAYVLRRFSVRPGMTGLWQIRGRARLGYEEWARLDLRYIDEWSIFQDLKILGLTIPAVIKGTGAD